MGSIYPGSPQQRRQTRICVTTCGNASHCPPKCARQKNSECFFAKLKGVCYRPATFASEQAFPGSSAVEQPAVNRLVDGSNPSRGANKFKHLVRSPETLLNPGKIWDGIALVSLPAFLFRAFPAKIHSSQ